MERHSHYHLLAVIEKVNCSLLDVNCQIRSCNYYFDWNLLQ